MPCLIVVSGQKRWLFFSRNRKPGKASNNDIQMFSLATDRRNRSDFATTLPELYVSMCSNRQNRAPKTAVKRLNRYEWRPIVTYSPATARGLKILVSAGVVSSLPTCLNGPGLN